MDPEAVFAGMSERMRHRGGGRANTEQVREIRPPDWLQRRVLKPRVGGRGDQQQKKPSVAPASRAHLGNRDVMGRARPEVIDRGIKRVRVLAQEVHENVFYGVLDAHKVQSIDKIPSFEALKAVVNDLQNTAQVIAA